MFSGKKKVKKDPAPDSWEHTKEVYEILSLCRSLCTYSGYANVDSSGELVLQKWPKKNKGQFDNLIMPLHKSLIWLGQKILYSWKTSRNKERTGMLKLHIGQVQLKHRVGGGINEGL